MSDAPTYPGFLITFEGIDGTGKSTQLRLLAEQLRERGYDVLTTREPGGSPAAEEIRDILVKGSIKKMDSLSELFLFSAARRDHVQKTIIPHLAKGRKAIVLCDRFTDSTRVYQSRSGIPMVTIDYMIKLATNDLSPDMTFVLDIDPKIGVERSLIRRGNEETRFESLDMAFYNEAREMFLSLAEIYNQRCVVVPVDGDISSVAKKIAEIALNIFEPVK